MSRWGAISAALGLIAACFPAGAEAGGPARPDVTCVACIVVADEDRVLWQRSAHEPRPNASTTKMITALVTVARVQLDEQVEVSATAAATGGGGLALAPGDRYSVAELLYALLLTSSNDAAVALAEHVAGSEAAFVRLMNDLAAALGATRTRFVTAHGLDAPGHYSTAADLAAIAFEVLEDPVLATIVRAEEATIDGPDARLRLENRNALLETYAGASGVKTGYTAGAGNVLVASARRRGRVVVAVAMGSADAAADAAGLLDLGFARLARTVLLRGNAPVGAVVFDPGGATTIVASHTVRGLADPDDVRTSVVVGDSAPPLDPGEPVGGVVLRARGRVVGRVDAVARTAVSNAGAPAWPVDALSALLRGFSALIPRPPG